MEQELLKKISLKLTTDHDHYIRSFRKNLNLYVQEKDITLRDISDASGIAYSTLNSLLYGGATDCKLSTAVALARALHVSIDELTGADTISPITRKNIAICRNLPDNAFYLICWYIKHQYYLNRKNPKGRRIISVMQVSCSNNGNLKLTDEYKSVDITDLSPDICRKIFFGVKIPYEHYVPTYTPYDIILIANDRPASSGENCLIVIDDNLYIMKRKLEDGIPKYYNIRDGKYHIDEADVDEVIGYIAHVLRF